MNGLLGYRTVALGVCVTLGITACAAEDDPLVLEQGPLGAVSSPIVNGQLDTTHEAVVAWIHGSKCSATIVHVDGSTGYALTAAHCVGGSNGTLRQGENHNSADRTYNVVDQEIHPRYGEAEAFDFAMLTFTGADTNTPTMDVLTPAQDTMGIGSPVTMVGYGITPSNNSRRRFATNTLSNDLTNDIFVSYDQSGGKGGVCSGDSGGPSFFQVGGTEYVAAVHSFVSQGNNTPQCEGIGVSVRASGVLDSFIQPYIDGQPYGRESCAVCRDAHVRAGFDIVAGCEAPLETCIQSNACLEYNQCFANCIGQSCRNACGQDNPTGKQQFDAIDACVCNSACTTECAGDEICEPDPACWIDLADDSCESCLDNACCAEATACSTENACLSCATGKSTINCDASPEFVALAACLENSCGDTCPDFGLPAGTGGAGGTGAGGGDAGPAGVGAGPTSGGGDEDDGETVVTSGCSVGAPGENTPVMAFLLGLVALGFKRRRR